MTAVVAIKIMEGRDLPETVELVSFSPEHLLTVWLEQGLFLDQC